MRGRPFRARGVTYGTFAPRLDGALYPEFSEIKRDFQAISDTGFNTVRTYALPPFDVIELADEYDLRLLVGLHYDDWRQETVPGKAANRRVLDAGRRAVSEAMEACAGRECVLGVAVGNEVPGDLVRFHGIEAVQETLSSLIDEVHASDRDMLATYTNFPTTEYLNVVGQDFVSFNVFLEHPDALRRYVKHLQVVSADLPLVIAELGLAEAVHGAEAQATSLGWQLRIIDECGAAGAAVFSWTDEWAVGGTPVEGWGFGLTDSQRTPKLALETASLWARSSMRDLRKEWPRVSVVVCAYNEARYIGDCLASLQACDYPDLEVIVCDDGSTDGTDEIARKFPVELLGLAHGGLSAARNAGIDASSGKIVAFLDADAVCHPDWPYHIVLSLEDQNVAATGGPNLPVPEASFVERAVAKSPGGPIHVLVSADRAEHVPGCNMAFRKAPLTAVGGFDPVYTAAGDDVDVCWKLIDRDYHIAFSAPAQVYHHRRGTVRGYLRQQRGYGRAERLLYAGHRHRFNRLGQARWAGLIYEGPRLLSSLLRPLIYHGPMGTAAFQHVVHRGAEAAGAWSSALLPLAIPAFVAGLALAPVSRAWLALPALVAGLVLGYFVSMALAVRVERDEPRPVALRLLVAALHIAQPIVRSWGRLRGGGRMAVVNGTDSGVNGYEWDGHRVRWLRALRREMSSWRCTVKVGEPHDPWDLTASIGPFIICRVTTAVAWGWTPLYRVRTSLRPPALAGIALGGVLMVLGAASGPPVLALTAAGMLVEALVLRRMVKRALRVTTEGARR